MKIWSSSVPPLTSPRTQPGFTTACPTTIRTWYHSIHSTCCSSASQTGTYLHCLGKKSAAEYLQCSSQQIIESNKSYCFKHMFYCLSISNKCRYPVSFGLSISVAHHLISILCSLQYLREKKRESCALTALQLVQKGFYICMLEFGWPRKERSLSTNVAIQWNNCI